MTKPSLGDHEARPAWRAVPGGVWAMGFASLFMDMSSELIHSLLPLFLVSTLGASMVTVGLIEGIAEATAAFAKVFSGALSDWLGQRKWLMVAGYGLAALTKPVFALASSVGWVFGARFVDRVGKGIRGAPRDALVADLTPASLRGAAYGLRQALDSVGALLGPLLALMLMALFADNLRMAMSFAVLPALVSVALLVRYVRDPGVAADGPAASGSQRERWTIAGAARLPARFWAVVAVAAALTLARFSEAFLVLRARDVGLALGAVPVVMIVMNLTYAGLAFPAGQLADRTGARRLLLAGLGLLIVADIVLARVPHVAGVMVGAALWGVHMALTQGLLSKLVADTAPQALRGTAFGVLNFVTGTALLVASALAGTLWEVSGPSATFLAGAGFAGAAALGLLALARRAR